MSLGKGFFSIGRKWLKRRLGLKEIFLKYYKIYFYRFIIGDLIRKFDAFGIKPSFTRSGKEKFRIFCGNITMMIVFALILAFLVIMVIEPVCKHSFISYLFSL